jgi:ABC-2 type transport system permease protein
MNLNRTSAIVIRHLYLVGGSPARVLPLFAWVAIDMVLWGFITRYLNAVSAAKFDFVPIFLGAVLLWDFFTRVMHGVTMAFMEDVWSRNFLNIFATPLSISEYVGGLVLSSIATSTVGLVVMIVLASTFGIALGILGAAVVLRFGPASEWFIWPVPALVSPFAGVFYPIATLPRWMQYICLGLPPAYVFENVRAIVAGSAPSARGLSIGVVLAIIDVFVACWVFVRVYRHSVRTGLIARYSAETVT